MTRFRSFHKQT